MENRLKNILSLTIISLLLTLIEIPIYGKTVWRPVESRDEVENATETDRFILVAPDADRILCYSNQQYVEEVTVTDEITDIPETAFQFKVLKDEFERLYFRAYNRNLFLTVQKTSVCIDSTHSTMPNDFNEFPYLKLGNYYLAYLNGNFVRSSSKTSGAHIYKAYNKEESLSLVKFYLDDEEVQDGAVINDGVGKTFRVDAPEGCDVFYKDENDAIEHIMYNKTLTFKHPGTYQIFVRNEDEDQVLVITIVINGLFIENGLDFTTNPYGFKILQPGEWQTSATSSFSATTDNGTDMFIPKGQNIALRNEDGQQYLEMEPGSCFNIAVTDKRIINIIIEGTGLENITFREVPQMGNTVPTHEQIYTKLLYYDRQSSEDTKAEWAASIGANIKGLHIVNGRDQELTRATGESAKIFSIGLQSDIQTNVQEIQATMPIFEETAVYYDLSGTQLTGTPTLPGIYLIRTSDGFKKILVL